jgi:transglutaminase-like putative cysteine protease
MVRLRPRTDGCQDLQAYLLGIDPQPAGLSWITDLDGNASAQVWFEHPTDRLRVTTSASVVTSRPNPFDYLLLPWAVRLPIDYPTSLLSQLQPYLHGSWLTQIQPVNAGVVQLAHELLHITAGEITLFLAQLNQRIYENCQYITRQNGDPWPAGVTWQKQTGSCRDLAVLFIETCRAVGLAARFVSGYQAYALHSPFYQPDLSQAQIMAAEQEERQLHAWAEVYLPGAGWRGYDPTEGLAVADHHVALAASALPQFTAPVAGSFLGKGIVSTMDYQLSIQVTA